MQTNFSLAQLADPEIKVAEKILRSCVHCGFCTATCPTYVLLGDELDSPRGRIYLIKDMLEKDKPANEEVTLHIDRCLSCLACMTTCPSGVDYMHLVDHARAHIEATYKRPLADRLMRSLVANILPYPKRFRAAIAAAFFARPFAFVFERIPGLRRLAPMLKLAPYRLVPRSPTERGSNFAPRGDRRGRVALLRGCAQSVLDPGINDAAIRLLTRSGIEVVMPPAAGCCGALTHHMGRNDESHAQAKQIIDAWIAEIDGEGLDAILVTTSGCGTTVKDYGNMLADEPEWHEKALQVAKLARDVSEVMLDIGLVNVEPKGLTVAYHSACSMQHGQKVIEQPKRLLRDAGFVVKDVPEGHLCCGWAGTYQVLQPDLSRRLRDRKVANIESVKPDVIAAGNFGCIGNIASGTGIPIAHTVELLDWATGGPKPAALD